MALNDAEVSCWTSLQQLFSPRGLDQTAQICQGRAGDNTTAARHLVSIGHSLLALKADRGRSHRRSLLMSKGTGSTRGDLSLVIWQPRPTGQTYPGALTDCGLSAGRSDIKQREHGCIELESRGKRLMPGAS